MKERNENTEIRQGIFHGSSKGFGFVRPLDPQSGEEDWFIPASATKNAWDGDTVTLVPTSFTRHSARITSVLSRANPHLTGVLHHSGHQWFLTPDNTKIGVSVLISGKTKGFSSNLRVAVKILSYGTEKTPPLGSVEQIFGDFGTFSGAKAAILYRYDVNENFPDHVLADADQVPRSVTPEDLQTLTPQGFQPREDFRDQVVVTIDSASAKDLDDAVSMTLDPLGRKVLGVHIADVSHYVKAKSALDQEAFLRGTSVYYVEKVAPMLPKALSNNICSLNPQVDRLTLSCLMTLDEGGEVVESRVVKGVIRTADRLNYDEVNLFLEGTLPPSGPLSENGPKSAEIRRLLTDLNHLAHQRVKTRRQRGALELESTECYFQLNEAGEPVAVVKRQTGQAESLIEECMLLANETVARFLVEHHLPGVFRVHEKPSEDKTTGLRRMLAPLGYDLKDGGAQQLQKLLDFYQDQPQQGAVNMMVLRSLMKARYDAANLGHFGLGAEYYCHFTSPIRRYPDLMVHRILTAVLEGKPTASLARFTPEAARQSSEREIAAATAEREIDKLYMAQYMALHLGETFPGAVTGASRYGLFVGLENGVEGFLSVNALPRGHYDFDEDTMTLHAPQGDYSFGTALEVVCAAADPSTGRIDFVLPGGELGQVKRHGDGKPPRPPKPLGRKGGKRSSHPAKHRKHRR